MIMNYLEYLSKKTIEIRCIYNEYKQLNIELNQKNDFLDNWDDYICLWPTIESINDGRPPVRIPAHMVKEIILYNEIEIRERIKEIERMIDNHEI